MFDYPTLTALADYVSQQLVPDTSVAMEMPAQVGVDPLEGGCSFNSNVNWGTQYRPQITMVLMKGTPIKVPLILGAALDWRPTFLTHAQVASRAGAATSNEAIAVLGGACHLPGDSWSLEKFDFMLSQGVDCSVEMPQSRWDVDDYYDPDATTGLKMYVRHAAFIEGVELFAATARN